MAKLSTAHGFIAINLYKSILYAFFSLLKTCRENMDAFQEIIFIYLCLGLLFILRFILIQQNTWSGDIHHTYREAF